MNMKGTAKRKMADFLQRMEELYRSIRIRLKALLLRISMVVPLVMQIISLGTPPYRIALARKRVVKRFYYPRKFAPFTRGLAFWSLG